MGGGSREMLDKENQTNNADVGTHMTDGLIEELEGFAKRGLRRMYKPNNHSFVFRVQKGRNGIVPQGMSLRYTAISLIGLAECDEETSRRILSGHSCKDVCDHFDRNIDTINNIGDMALCLWASNRNHYTKRDNMIRKLISFEPDRKSYPTVELSWVLEALSREKHDEAREMAGKLAKRLMDSQNPKSGVFPHVIGKTQGIRRHVSCFADAVYPIHALSTFSSRAGNDNALNAAARCAEMICRGQGSAGQWWWHYDVRTGGVVEGYPVYSVHQDSMGPMALFALMSAGGPDFRENIKRGLDWLVFSEEIEGSLLDHKQDLIWRKVARKEPNKLTRLLQATAVNVSPSIRVPGVDALFPAKTIDFENRPYHLGWILYAWNQGYKEMWAK